MAIELYEAMRTTRAVRRLRTDPGLGCVLTTLLCMAEGEIRPLLTLPEPGCTAAFIPIGYPTGSGHGPLTRKPLGEMVYLDRWGAPLVA